MINHAPAMAQPPEKPPYTPPTSAEELLERYAKGERRFHHANLTRADLGGANLRDANVSNADLVGANLRGADLSGAKLSGAYLVGARLEGADLSGANFHEAHLEGVKLSDAYLVSADFTGANLEGADFTGANLENADLSNTNFFNANLTRANLGDANLRDADLGNADLVGADLSGANLGGADLSGANLSGATLSGATLGYAHLGRLSLIEFCKADPQIQHNGPSSIDFESITLSLLAPNLEKFLIRAGIPAIAAQYMIESARAVKGTVWDMMQSVFISFGGPDEPFARKLFEALHSNGVRTFFFPEHAEPGKPLHRLMRDAVKEHDRVVLVCSKNSLTRNGVLVEIEESLRRESKQGGEMILIPITLDDFIYEEKDEDKWQPPDPGTRDALLARVVADFRGLDKEPAKFDVEVLKLLRALRVKNPAPTLP